jgi:hypothetical protein
MQSNEMGPAEFLEIVVQPNVREMNEHYGICGLP